MGTTRIPKGRARISITLDEDVLAAIDKIAEEAEMSRSGVIETCIESGLDDLKLLAFLGLTPRRLNVLVKRLQRLKRWKSGAVEIDFQDVAKKLEQARDGGDLS